MPEHRRLCAAFVTWSGEPAIAEDDALLADACRALELEVEAAPWDLPRDWRRYDAIVLRTTWNYHRLPDLFERWIERDLAGVPLFNPASVVRWNMHKGYLLDLAQPGVVVPGTTLVRRGSTTTLTRVLDQHGWAQAVVKPAISANAYETTLVAGADRAAGAMFAAAVAERDTIVQEFVPEISAGELSLMFFGGEFSHAVRKRPAPGEFRVQESHGGTHEPFVPDLQTIAACRRLLRQVPGPTLYARVDGMPVGGSFVLLEIEAIEPSLFVGSDPGAAARFARALLTGLGGLLPGD